MKVDLYQRPKWAKYLLTTLIFEDEQQFSEEEQLELARIVASAKDPKLDTEAASSNNVTVLKVIRLLVSEAVDFADDKIARELMCSKKLNQVLTFEQKQKLYRLIVDSESVVSHLGMILKYGKGLKWAEKKAFVRGLLRRNSRKLATQALDDWDIYYAIKDDRDLLRAFVPIVGYHRWLKNI